MSKQGRLYIKVSSIPLTEKGIDTTFDAAAYINSGDVMFVACNTDLRKARMDGYAELGVALAFRTAYGNKVIVHNRNPFLYGSINGLPGTGRTSNDMVMLSAASALRSVCNTSEVYNTDFNTIMVNTQFQYKGLINLKPDILQPLLFCQVILHDSMEHEIEPYFIEGTAWEHISSILEHPTDYTVAFYPNAFLNEMLVLTKEE